MSKDTIYRQAAIDANDAAFWETKNKKHYTKLKMLQSHAFLVETALKDLPSAQPETCAYWDRESNICALHRPSAQQNLQLTCNQLATDSISRQAAIDAFYIQSDDDGWWTGTAEDMENLLKALPSAQPEDKCGECDTWNQYKNYPQQRWIPCSERLPKRGTDVLITNNKGHVSYGRFRGVEFWKEDGCSYWTWRKNTIEHVVAWRPLPEPYTERREE